MALEIIQEALSEGRLAPGGGLITEGTVAQRPPHVAASLLLWTCSIDARALP